MSVLRNVKNIVKQYTDNEIKVREATSNDPWGPTTNQMAEICDLMHNDCHMNEVLEVIFKRLNDHGKNWRHVYKSLTVIQYLIVNANDAVISYIRKHLYLIHTLKEFHYVDKDGKDTGVNVREKCKQVIKLLNDEEYFKEEKIKAETTKSRIAPKSNSYIKSSSYSTVWTAPEKAAEIETINIYITDNQKSNQSIYKSQKNDDTDFKKAVELSLIEEEQRQRIAKLENEHLNNAIFESRSQYEKSHAFQNSYIVDPFAISNTNSNYTTQDNDFSSTMSQTLGSNPILAVQNSSFQLTNTQGNYSYQNQGNDSYQNHGNDSYQNQGNDSYQNQIFNTDNQIENDFFSQQPGFAYGNNHMTISQQSSNNTDSLFSLAPLVPLSTYPSTQVTETKKPSNNAIFESESNTNIFENLNKSSLLNLYENQNSLVNLDTIGRPSVGTGVNFAPSNNPFIPQKKPISLNEMRINPNPSNSSGRLF